MKSLTRFWIALVLAIVGTAPARAETWLSLETNVNFCVLIVKCKTEGGKGYRVIETWKGKYSPDLFLFPPPDGYILTNRWHGNEEGAEGREIVFFFSSPGLGNKLESHSTAFHVKNGRVVYASTSWTMKQEFTIEEFRQSILWTVRKQALTTRSAIPALLGGLAVADSLPEVPEVEKTSPALVQAPAAEPEVASLSQPNVGPAWWLWVGAGGLLAGLIFIALTWYGRQGRAEPTAAADGGA